MEAVRTPPVQAHPGQLSAARSHRLSLSRRSTLVLAYALGLLPAVFMALVQPVWQLTDEAQHTDVMAQYAHGVYPIEGRTTLRPETVSVMKQTGVWRWSVPEQLPRPDVIDAARFEPPPAHLSGYNYNLWVRRHIWWFSYEAMQPPLFYAIATPLWIGASALGGPVAAVFAGRLLNSLVLALLAPLALLAAWRLAPQRRDIALAAVLFTALLPGLLMNGTQVTNDTFGAVLGAATVLYAMRHCRALWTPRVAVVAGALTGLTLLAKLTAVGVGFGLLLAILLPVARERGLSWPPTIDRPALARQLAMGALAMTACLVVMAPWMALNLHAVGSPVMNREAASLLGAGTSSGRYNPGQDLLYAFSTWWTGEHQWSLPLSGVETILAVPFAMGAIVGLQRVLRGSVLRGIARPEFYVCLTAVAAQSAWAFAVPFIGGLGGMTPGRYLYPAVVPSLLLVVVGAWGYFRSLPWRRFVVSGFVLLTILNVAGYAAGYTGVRHESRVGPPGNLRTTDVNGAGSYQGVTIAVDRLVEDRRREAMWIHVIVRNESIRPADWWPGPAIFLPGDGERVRGDFSGSTPFPETLPAQSEYSGWVKLLMSPKDVRRPGQLHLIFEDVAANDYRDVGTIPMTLALPPRE